jgi:hypothetical protein
MPKWLWPIFDFLIVALMQNALLLATAVSALTNSALRSFADQRMYSHVIIQLPQFLLLSMSVVWLVPMSDSLTPHTFAATTRSYHPTHPAVPLGKVDFLIAGLFLANLAVEQVRLR